MVAVFSGCAGMRPTPDKTKDIGLPVPEIVNTPGDSGKGDNSRMAASHSLITQGYRLLKKENYDDAIRVLERAIGINSGNGPGYFYLSEAWLKKKNFDLAARFNELAILYLRNNTEWHQRAMVQKERIEQKINNTAEP